MSSTEKLISEIDITAYPATSVSRVWLHIIEDEFGQSCQIPVMIMQGAQPGPVLGLTAAVHGNELNGISVIHNLFRQVRPKELSGTIVAFPAVNVPGLKAGTREFPDGIDLNRIMPGTGGRRHGELYANTFFEKAIQGKLNYLLDLHTASQGRINSFYIRSDLSNEESGILAELQNAEIIVHSPPADGTLRGAAADVGIPSITLEVGNPDVIQKSMTRSGTEGILNVLHFSGMLKGEIKAPEEQAVYCSHSVWLYTDQGGMLSVKPRLAAEIQEGHLLATLHDIFGNPVREFQAEQRAFVIGKSVKPFNMSGGRIIHLGFPGEVTPN